MPSCSLHPLDAVQRFGCSQQVFCRAKFAFAERSAAMKAPVGLLSDRTVCDSRWRGLAPTSSQMYIRLHCLRVLWNLSRCFPNLKIILWSGPSVFKFNLKRTVIFSSEVFEFATAASRASWYQLAIFWIWFYKSDFKNTCWASPKPDIQHKIAPTVHPRWHRISKFSWRKNCFRKIVVDSFNIAQNRNYYFRFWRQKAEVSLPKKSSNFMVCSIQSRSQEQDLPSPVFSLKTGPDTS